MREGETLDPFGRHYGGASSFWMLFHIRSPRSPEVDLGLSLEVRVAVEFVGLADEMLTRFSRWFAAKHRAKEWANAPLTKRCVLPTVLFGSSREGIRRQANPRVAGRLSHGCPGEARGFPRILRWLDRAHPHSRTEDATAQDRRFAQHLHSSIHRNFRFYPRTKNVSSNRSRCRH